MPRDAKTADPWPDLIDLLADALAARLDFPPRPSSAASALAAPASAAPARAPRAKAGTRSPALVARMTEELLGALAARLDFPPRPSSAASALAAPPVARPRRRGQRRTPEQVARLATELRTYLRSHPGARLEQLAAALGQPSRALELPIKALLSQGKIRARRVKQVTRYYGA
jgi:hypothetical protein